MFEMSEDEFLAHYGTPRKSGRYPWGSGGDHPQHNQMLIDHINKLKKQGLSEVQIAEGLDMSTTQLRAERSIAKNQLKAEQINQARKLKEKGVSDSEGARMMGIPGSTYRTLVADGAQAKVDATSRVADILKDQVDRHEIVDVGAGVDAQLGIPSTRLNTAVEMLRAQGYEYHTYNLPQVTTMHDTKMKVICKPGMTQNEAWSRRFEVKPPDVFDTGGPTKMPKKFDPISIDLKRVDVRYKEDGGDSADGVIFVRPGKEDISLGGNQYAQVRVMVNGTHYLKGMAVYKDDIPGNADLVFNTSKSKHDAPNKLDAMKPLKDNKDFPFGSITRPVIINPGTDEAHVKSVMNLVNDTGDWEKWSNTLSSQMLSKQHRTLVKQQLDMTYERRKDELENIKSLTNPVVKRKLLEEFADNTDAAAVHLKAASLPAQRVQVLLPLSKIKETEVYAPSFKQGTQVVLIRHPHGGVFEIPSLKVNNRVPEGKKLIGDMSTTAIGIHHKVAEALSGADFDGDTVLVIPNNSGRVKHQPPLADLKGFDPRTTYKKYPGMKVMSDTQGEMGKISNLITDMTLKGASDAELARAVKHSMVVIDAEKHELNYKQSERDHAIGALKDKYQRDPVTGSRGAATLISRARGEVWVNQRKARPASEGGPLDPKTGERMFVPTNRPNKSGGLRKEKSTRLAEAKDARELLSGPHHEGTPKEIVYADYSNRMKSLANQSRLDATRIANPKQSSSARQVYEPQVKSLEAKLRQAKRNAPLERHAQAIANASYQAKVHANPHLDKDEKKKLRTQEIELARAKVGAKKKRIEIEPDEWEAIQASAISASKLRDILSNADMDRVREYALPRGGIKMTDAKVARMKSMLELGYDRADIASALGVSTRTLDTAIAETK